MRRGKTYSGHGRVLSGSENGPRCVIAFLKTACLALAWIPPPPPIRPGTSGATVEKVDRGLAWSGVLSGEFKGRTGRE